MRTFRLLGLVAAVALPLLALGKSGAEAHSACTSKFTYNGDVFPVLQKRCGTCHVTGGAAPMSLLTFKDATQWASGMRDELSTERMPPWHVDPASPAVKGGNAITAGEINTIVDWGACNTPHGDLTKVLPVTKFTPEWKLGTPDLTLQMPAAHVVGADTHEEVVDVAIPSGLSETRWVKAADLMPQATALVRDAVIRVDNGPVLALWEPGNDPVAAPAGTAFKLAANTTLHLQIHYKKNYLNESQTISDQSTVGLYFSDAPAGGNELQALAIDPPAGSDASATQTFSATVLSKARVVALRPILDQPYDVVGVTAIDANGRRQALLDLRSAWPQWFRRYWLQTPIELAPGTKVEVRVTPRAPDPSEQRPPKRFPLEVDIDYVAD
jgi:hypothetical protein